ncbi:MAG TPA: ABC transporter permease [Deltaproteobacteria bacterium]|nr:ABC transporter permease [Deltaproteobacteria bacterium]HOM29643.1 ABC transporter permease [Deltaproteobacteria bacterium]HPP80218.1 ABC transporter permease [Deltaproteobacteria bacterium]
MALPLAYNLRNLWTRKVATVLTASGMALVVFVFASSSMLSEGLKKTLVETGSPDNVVVVRKGATSEVDSSVERWQAHVVEALGQAAPSDDGSPLSAREVLVLVTLPRVSGGVSNVAVRGIGRHSAGLRPQVRIVQGRMPRFGAREVAVGSSIARRFAGIVPGGTVRLALDEYRIVGIMDASGTAFSSEVWADADQIMQTFRRPVYSSLVFRLSRPERFKEVQAAIEGDPRLTLKAEPESSYWRKQSELMAMFLEILGMSLALLFSIGAVIGGMVTMHAAVAGRTSEIGTLRALGFGRRHILLGFIAEALILGLAGGLAGLALASLLQFVTVSTVNFQTFSELAFSFELGARTVAESLLFSLAMGFAGGFMPALKASRMNIVEALRTA